MASNLDTQMSAWLHGLLDNFIVHTQPVKWCRHVFIFNNIFTFQVELQISCTPWWTCWLHHNEYILFMFMKSIKMENKCSLDILPSYLCISEALHVVLARSGPASLLWLLFVITVVGLALGARGVGLQLGAHIAVAIIGLSLKEPEQQQITLFRCWRAAGRWTAVQCDWKCYPLVRAPASGQHEDVFHLPLLLLLLNFTPLLFGDDIIPFSYWPSLELCSALFHAGEIGHLRRQTQREDRVERDGCFTLTYWHEAKQKQLAGTLNCDRSSSVALEPWSLSLVSANLRISSISISYRDKKVSWFKFYKHVTQVSFWMNRR